MLSLFASKRLASSSVRLLLHSLSTETAASGAPLPSPPTFPTSSVSSVFNGIRKPHVKHKIPKKRASSMLAILQKEEWELAKNGREYPYIEPGDSVMVEQLPYMTATTTEMVKGVVIARPRKGMNTTIHLLNVEYGTPVKRVIPIYNPLVKNITILQKAFIHQGKKRVRRAKLYYLEKKDPTLYTVK